MKTSSCKAKGRNLQYWAAEQLAGVLGIEFNQQDDLCPVHSREMGQSGKDVYIRDKALVEKFPFSVECKNTETISLYSYIEQAKRNTTPDTSWLVIHKKNKSKPVVIMDGEVFFKMVSELNALRDKSGTDSNA